MSLVPPVKIISPNEKSNKLNSKVKIENLSNRDPLNNSSLPKISYNKSRKSHSFSYSNSQKPSILPQLKLIQEFKSNYESASSLQHTIQSISFTKAPRFLKNQNDESQFISLSSKSKFNGRATSFGYGNKQFIPLAYLNNAKNIPASNQYKIPSDFDFLKKGKTFGVSRDKYTKSYIQGMNEMPIDVAREIPGPGQYDVSKSYPEKNKGFSLLGKGITFNCVNVDNTAPGNIYNPKNEFIELKLIRNIKFGTGKRTDFTKIEEKTPGPGTYNFPNLFEKYKNRKKFFENYV